METSHVTNSNSSILPHKRKPDEIEEENRKKIRMLVDDQMHQLQIIKESLEANDQNFPKELIAQFHQLSESNSEAIVTLQSIENNRRSECFLPQEIVIRIFSFLDHETFFDMQQVCKFFARLSADKRCSFTRNLALAKRICKENALSEKFLKLVKESVRIGYMEIIRNARRVQAPFEQTYLCSLFLQSTLFEDFIQKKIAAGEDGDVIEIAEMLPVFEYFKELSTLYCKLIHAQAKKGKIESALETRKKFEKIKEEYPESRLSSDCAQYDIFHVFECEVEHRDIPLSKSLVLAEIFNGEIQGLEDIAVLEKLVTQYFNQCSLHVICSVCCFQAKRELGKKNVQKAIELFKFVKEEAKKDSYHCFPIHKTTSIFCLCNSAVSENECGFKKEALVTLSEAHKMASGSASLLTAVAETQLEINGSESAKALFDEIQKLGEGYPDKARFLLKHSVPLAKLLGDHNYADELLLRAQEFERNSTLAFERPDFDFIGYLLELGRIQEARALVEEISPDHLNYHIKLVDYYVDHNQIEEAEKVVDLCLSDHRNFAYMVARIAHLYEKTGRSHAARTMLKKISDPVLEFMAYLSLISPEGPRLLFFETWHPFEKNKF